MKTYLFCPFWGFEELGHIPFLHKIKEAGYDGTEMILPYDISLKSDIVSAADDLDLLIIGHWGGPIAGDFNTVLETYERHLRNACSVSPLFVNAQTGRDFYTYEQNCQLINIASTVSHQTGVRIIHETHRSKFSYSAYVTREYLERDSSLRLTADFSHWCCVSETLLQDQTETINLAIERSDHIHARVGFEEGPQIPDPRTPEWKYALDAHLVWWDRIIAQKKAQNQEYVTITPEFGPFPYMPKMPFTGLPISSQWEINLFMKNLLRERYT